MQGSVVSARMMCLESYASSCGALLPTILPAAVHGICRFSYYPGTYQFNPLFHAIKFACFEGSWVVGDVLTSRLCEPTL